MQVAKIENGKIVVANYTEMFPNVVFPATGLPAEFVAEHNLKMVSLHKEYDAKTQVLEQCEPYLEGDVVYLVKVVNKPAEQVASEAAAAVAQFKEMVVQRVQDRLDAFAKTRNYDGILSAATYATDPNPAFAAEGQHAVEARSATWAKLYQILAEVQAGTRQMPTSFEAIEGELPVLAWQ